MGVFRGLSRVLRVRVVGVFRLVRGLWVRWLRGVGGVRRMEPRGRAVRMLVERRGGEHVPPEAVRAAARRGLVMFKDGEAGGGLEPATVARARRIAAGRPLSHDHVMRMYSFFERHNKTRPDDGGVGKSPWRTAWNLWGGNAGRAWAASKARRS